MARRPRSVNRGITVTPDLRTFAGDLARATGRPLEQIIDEVNRRHKDVPLREIRRRANALGSGRRRIARDVDVTVGYDKLVITGGANLADWAGQEFGSFRFAQFLPHNFKGYVVGAVVDDTAFTDELGELYHDGIVEVFRDVLND